MASERWWKGATEERYWLEATDRDDIGTDLRAPELDEGGEPNWRYTLFKEAMAGDIVFHYDKSATANGIIGFSIVAGAWKAEPIVWAARGTYARDKGTKPHERPGFVVPLKGFQRLPTVLTLDHIRQHTIAMREMLQSLQREHSGLPLYFPFELSEKRPSRLLQGYAFKLPSAFLQVFPDLSAPLLGDARIEYPAKSNTRNPPWSRDELILALDLYMTNPASPPGKNSKEVAELSVLLNEIGNRLGFPHGVSYRNSNGVYMKMMNFRRFDETYKNTGKVGLTRGNKDEEAVWNEFAHDRAHLSVVAAAIRTTLHLSEGILLTDDDIVEAEEGRILTRLHCTRERNRKLVEQRKAKALIQGGHLECEVCGFDFEQCYGKRGRGFIEAHHTKPIHTLAEGATTKLEDLALVCSNCHRMIHATRPWLTINELRGLLQKA